MSALIINDVPIECINYAAIEYHVPATLIISVLKTEGGRVGMANLNRNGTYDYGPMQINSIWLKKIAPYGYTRDDIQFNACDNVQVGTWILAQSIADGAIADGGAWQGVGDYHSHSYYKNVSYRAKVEHYYQWLSRYLNGQQKPK